MSQKTRRQKRRSSDAPMPSGGAGLMRFYQDESMGIKVSPKVTILCSVVLIVMVIFAYLGYLDIFFG